MRFRGACIEEGGRRMDEETLRHEIVSLNGSINVVAVNTNSDAHDEVLRPFGRTPVDFKKI